MPTDTRELTDALGGVLEPVLGPGLLVSGLARVAGGSSRETWSFTAVGPAGPARYILRRDPPGAPASGVRLEAGLLAAAAKAGVPVPGLVAAGGPEAGLDAAFVVVEFVEGETIPRRILRDDALGAARRRLATQCGEVLAAIHAIPPAEVPGLAGGDQLEGLRGLLDHLAQPHPAFELGLRWLAETRPPRTAQTVVHGDFRNGNFIVGAEGLRAVLDWELAHLGDPVEDLGWLCVRAWRFGSPRRVGGFGDVDDLLAAYERASGRHVDAAVLHWWEVLGTVRWGVICIVQAMTHLSGMVRSVELAAIGRRVCEVEWDLLDLLPETGGHTSDTPASSEASAGSPGAPHDAPSAVELLQAVREFLESDVVPATEGRLRFHARVAANVAGMVGREIELGPAQAVAHGRRLAQLGMADDAALARAIRAGELDGRLAEVTSIVRAGVADKLRVANPAYLTPALDDGR